VYGAERGARDGDDDRAGPRTSAEELDSQLHAEKLIALGGDGPITLGGAGDTRGEPAVEVAGAI